MYSSINIRNQAILDNEYFLMLGVHFVDNTPVIFVKRQIF